MRIHSALLVVTILMASKVGPAEELDGSLHFTGGTNENPRVAPTFEAGFHLDPALFLPPMKSQLFDTGLEYDRVQGHVGVSVDFRARMAFLRCYGSEYRCEARRRFWLTAISSLGKRWGEGGLGGYAGTQVQAVFDLRHQSACCKFAVGLEHRFPFNSSLHGDNALVLEWKIPIEFRDAAPPLPPVPKAPHP